MIFLINEDSNHPKKPSNDSIPTDYEMGIDRKKISKTQIGKISFNVVHDSIMLKHTLSIMLENPDLFKTGLCRWATLLYYRGDFTHKEYSNLYYYIINNRPWTFKSLFVKPSSKYYWTEGDIEPRIKWIKKQIKKL